MLIRLGGLGDVVFTLPAVKLLRAAYPNAHFTFVIYHEFAPLLEGFRAVDNVITVNRARFRRPNPLKIVPEGLVLLSRLFLKRFDLVVDFQGFGETAWTSWLTRAPQRWGSVYREKRRWAYTRPVWRDPELHAIDYHLSVVREGGGIKTERICNQFEPPEPAVVEAREIFRAHKLQPGLPTLYIQPFTSSPYKDWPLEHYLAVAQHWCQRGVQVLFGGGPGDKAGLEPARQAGFAVVAGSPILVSAALAQISTVVLGGDTGLLHLAVAMGKRVCMIMRCAQGNACVPFGHPEWTIVPPSGSPFEAITPEAVNEACAQALAEAGATVQHKSPGKSPVLSA